MNLSGKEHLQHLLHKQQHLSRDVKQISELRLLTATWTIWYFGLWCSVSASSLCSWNRLVICRQIYIILKIHQCAWDYMWFSKGTGLAYHFLTYFRLVPLQYVLSAECWKLHSFKGDKNNNKNSVPIATLKLQRVKRITFLIHRALFTYNHSFYVKVKLQDFLHYAQ